MSPPEQPTNSSTAAAPERGAPTLPPPGARDLAGALQRNIAALERRRREEAAAAPLEERVPAKITGFTGSMAFVYIHLALYGLWIVANLGWVGIEPWHPTFVVLAMIASVEAIFLSTFVLITQNRMAAAADKRAELDLQIGLLPEHEVTKIVGLVSAIADHLGNDHRDDVEELKRDVAPEAVLDAIDSTERRPQGALGEHA